MATPTIIRGSDHMFSTIYEGNGAGQRIGKFVPFTDSGTIAKSVIYNRGDTPKLTKTPSSNGNKRTYTISYWYKPSDLGTRRVVFSSDTSGSDYFYWEFDASNKIDLAQYSGPALRLQTNRTFEDTTKFYHFLLAVDTTQSTASDRLKLYVDGDQITSFAVETYPSQDLETKVNSTSYPMAVGSFNSLTSLCTGGNLAEYNFVDGTALTPSTFGLTDTTTGRWIPKALTGITYGTNGFRMEFANSAGQTIGDDTSGNGNDYTVSGLAATDITTDSPTQNHATLNSAVTAGTVTLSEGNLTLLGSGSSVYGSSRSTIELDVDDPTGYYFEARNTGSAIDNINIGFQDVGTALSATAYGGSNFYGLVSRGGGGSNQYWRILGGATDVTTSVGHSSNDWIGVAIKKGKVWFAINNTYVFSGNPATGATPFLDISSFAKRFYITIECFQNNKLECNFGQKSLNYSAPSGYVSIQQDNLPTTESGISDLVWIKNRDAGDSHQLYDSTRGPQKDLDPDATSEESTTTDGLQKFLKGGCQIEDDVSVNTSGESYVSWNWVGNGGTTATNNDGETTSIVQVNSTSNFSIGTFTSKSAEQTIGHGLGVVPEFIILKCRSNSQNWFVYHKQLDLTDSHYLHLNANDAEQTGSDFGNYVPTSSVFQANPTGTADRTYVFYAWAPVAGYSKFGSYFGNGSSEGPFVYTGFLPAWLMIKRKDSSTGGNWSIIDNTRYRANPIGTPLLADTTDAESGLSAITMDLLSNGFKIRNTLNSNNNSSGTYVYMAFAEHPFIGNGTNPVTAR
jgi:hypothetical protein